jgi:hypothetical protein
MSEYEWEDPFGRKLSDYSEEERLIWEHHAMASFLSHICERHPNVIIDWIQSHPKSDFTLWLRSYEHTGI